MLRNIMSVSPRLEKLPKPMSCHSRPIAPQEGGGGDVVVADVVNLEAAGIAVAQHQIGGIATHEPAEASKLPIGPDLTYLVARQNRVAADVVDLVLALSTMTQNHVGGGAGGRRRVRQRAFKVSVHSGAVAQDADDLAIVVDAICKGTAVRNGIIDVGENTVAIEKGVESALGVTV